MNMIKSDIFERHLLTCDFRHCTETTKLDLEESQEHIHKIMITISSKYVQNLEKIGIELTFRHEGVI